MEFVNGTSLDQFLDQHRSVIDADVARVFLQLLDALDYLHSKRFVHGEVSPRNILVSESGDVRLLDFEHCRRLDEAEPELWPSGTIAGIPIYMAPEQMRGEELHAEADYFVVGLLLLEHVRGQHPLKRSQGFVQLWPAIAQPNEEAVAEWLHDLKSRSWSCCENCCRLDGSAAGVVGPTFVPFSAPSSRAAGRPRSVDDDLPSENM
jgi:serine/threonine protein kinase